MDAEWRNNFSWEKRAIPALASDWHANIVIHGFAAYPVISNDSRYLGLLDQYVALTRAYHVRRVLVAVGCAERTTAAVSGYLGAAGVGDLGGAVQRRFARDVLASSGAA